MMQSFHQMYIYLIFTLDTFLSALNTDLNHTPKLKEAIRL